MINFIVALLIGGLSGWLAGKIMKSEGSLIRNIILGLVGGLVGGLLFGILGLGANGLLGSIIVSVAGACLLVWLGRKFLK